MLDISIKKWKVYYAIRDLRYRVLGVETKVAEKSCTTLNILFLLIVRKGILNVHV